MLGNRKIDFSIRNEMQLIRLWKNSLAILQPKNFQQFCLLVINTLWRTIRLLIGPCWWVGIIILIGIGLQFVTDSLLLKSILGHMNVFLMLLLSRPSIEAKDSYYIVQYLKKYLFSAVLLLAFIAISLFIGQQLSVSLLDLLNLQFDSSSHAFTLIYTVIANMIFIWFWLIILFVLDGHRHIIQSAACMMWYNMPIFLFYAIFVSGLDVFEYFLIDTLIVHYVHIMTDLHLYGYFYMTFLLKLLIKTAIISTLYTKCLYENYGDYVDKK